MKHVLNLIITLALIFFGIGLSIICIQTPQTSMGLLYVPLIALYILWGMHINEKY